MPIFIVRYSLLLLIEYWSLILVCYYCFIGISASSRMTSLAFSPIIYTAETIKRPGMRGNTLASTTRRLLVPRTRNLQLAVKRAISTPAPWLPPVPSPLNGGPLIVVVSPHTLAVTVKGVLGVSADGYRRAIDLIASGRFPLERLRSHTFPLDKAAQAVETLEAADPSERVMNVVIVP